MKCCAYQGPNGASPGAFIDVYVSGSGLRQAVYIDFVPSEQVTILDPTPTIDLDANNSSGSVGSDFDTSFTEDGPAVLIADLDATLGNVTELTALDVTITNQLDGVLETLAANIGVTSISANYNSGTGVLSLTGLDTVANYQQVLRTITYSNASQAPNTTDRSITFVAWLNTSDSSAATTTVTINSVNDAPILSATPTNPAMIENDPVVDLFNAVTIDTAESGQTIEELVFTVENVTDGNDEIIVIDGENVLLSNTNLLGELNTGVTLVNSYAYSVSLVGSTATVTLTTTGTSVANAQTLVDGLAYENSSDNPTTTSRVVTLTSIKDSGGILNGGVDTSIPAIASTVSITAVNDAPTYNPVALDPIDLNSPVRVITEAELLANVIDPEGDPLTATNLMISSGLGLLVDNLDGTWDYTPANNDDGSVEFTYTVSDGLLNTVNLAVMDISLIAVDSSSSGSTDNSAIITVAHTTSGENRLMLVGISGELDGETVDSVTYNGIALTLVEAEENVVSLDASVQIWQMVAPVTGTHNVVVNLSGGGHNGVVVGVTTFTEVNQTNPILAVITESGDSATPSVTLPSASDELVFGVVSVHSGSGVIPISGQREVWDVAAGHISGSGSVMGGAASVTSSWSTADKDWSAMAVSMQSVTTAHNTETFSAVQDAFIREQESPTANYGTGNSGFDDGLR